MAQTTYPTPFSVRLDSQVRAALQALVNRQGESAGEVIRGLILAKAEEIKSKKAAEQSVAVKEQAT